MKIFDIIQNNFGHQFYSFPENILFLQNIFHLVHGSILSLYLMKIFDNIQNNFGHQFYSFLENILLLQNIFHLVYGSILSLYLLKIFHIIQNNFGIWFYSFLKSVHVILYMSSCPCHLVHGSIHSLQLSYSVKLFFVSSILSLYPSPLFIV